MILKFLGTGTSTGVPTLGCTCGVCTSRHPKNQRTRSSVWIQEGEWSLLVDAGPDLRHQFLRQGLGRPSGILITHAHADHILGLDDLRPLSYKNPIPVWADGPSLKALQGFFPYMFSSAETETSRPDLIFQLLKDRFNLGPWSIQRIPVFHGRQEISGFRIGPLGYVTDCSRLPPGSMELLQGVQVMVLDALRYEPHPTHFSIDQAVEAAEKIGAPQTWFTHLGHSVDHETLAAQLPKGISPAWDGLVVEF